VRALKKAEDSDELVIRVQELYGRPGRTRVNFAASVIGAREINAAEEPVGPIATTNGILDVSLAPYQPRTFAVRLAPAPVRAAAPIVTPLAIPFNLDGISLDAGRGDGNFDGAGLTMAGELWPTELTMNGLTFELGSSRPGDANVLVPAAQTLRLPAGGGHNRLYLLAAAVGGDVPATIGFESATGIREHTFVVREWQAPIGQWYSTIKTERLLRQVVVPDMLRQTWTERAIADDMVTRFDPASDAVAGIDQIRPAFVKMDEIAWIGTHRHEPGGNQIYIPSYVFLYGLDLPAGTTAVRLPANTQIRILAVTAAREPSRAVPAGALYMAEIPRR
jgi:alpha-mannosidase